MDAPIKTSYLGTDIFDNVVFEVPEDDEFQGSTPLELDNVIVSFRNSKNIVRTVVTNRPGVVKEFVSRGDYEINIRGQLVEQQRETAPISQVELLRAYCNYDGPLEVVSEIFNAMEVSTVIIERFVIAQRAGFRNMIEFEINAISDEPLEVKLG
jgi:hypothetical protein